MSQRLPTILGKGIDDTYKTLNEQHDEERITDLVECVHRMEDLHADLSGNAKLRPIYDDGEGDVSLWNKARPSSSPLLSTLTSCVVLQEIAKYFQGKDFMSAPWLFAEAYKVRAALVLCYCVTPADISRAAVPTSARVLQQVQVLARVRHLLPPEGAPPLCSPCSPDRSSAHIAWGPQCDTFSRSSQAVFELSMRFSAPFQYEEGLHDEEKKLAARKNTFMELSQICLWVRPSLSI